MSSVADGKLTMEDITPARIKNDAALLRGLRELSRPESVVAAKRILEWAVEWQRPLSRAELNECIEQAVEATASESVVELDPERTARIAVDRTSILTTRPTKAEPLLGC